MARLGSALKRATGPLVRNLLGSFDDRITLRQIMDSTSTWPNGAPRKGWGDAATGVACLLAELTSQQLQQTWGRMPTMTLTLFVPMKGNVAPATDMGIIVTGGDRAGDRYSIGKVKTDTLAQLYTCELTQAQENF